MILEAQKEEVGSIIYYPIIVQINNERMEISNKEEFLRHYDEIISTDVITAVQNTTDPEDVSVSWRGAVIDRRISFDWCYDDESLCSKQIKIIGINN
jgi:beta-mannanase